MHQLQSYYLFLEANTIKEHSVENRRYKSSDIQKLFKITKDKFDELESSGLIPSPEKIKLGNINTKIWRTADLSVIGSMVGFLKKPKKKPLIITEFTKKGGVGKSSHSHALARTMAINGMKTLFIGLDTQQSSTVLTFPGLDLDSLTAMAPGLFHLFFEGATMEEVARETDLPTLHMIPETSELKALEEKINEQRLKEYFFKRTLLDKFSNYDVVIFDNAPAWSNLVENSAAIADVLISPVSCELGTLSVLPQNLAELNSFQTELNLNFDFIMIPTFLDHTNKLSCQIYEVYKRNYPEAILPYPIRKSIKGQEAQAFHISPIEYDPSSQLASDYFNSFVALFKRLNLDSSDSDKLPDSYKINDSNDNTVSVQM